MKMHAIAVHYSQLENDEEYLRSVSAADRAQAKTIHAQYLKDQAELEKVRLFPYGK